MKEYSFLNTSLLVNGVEIEGWDEGDDVISVARRVPAANSKVGTGGEMTVSLSADRSGTFTFRLMQVSDSNTFMSSLSNAHENGAFVPLAIQLTDIKGNDLASGTQGYIEKPADMVRGTNANAQEWIIVVENLEMLLLGAI